MKHKYVDVLDATVLGEGEMVALASTFGNVDRHGDRVIRGAYSSTVAKVKAGATLPLVWGHDVNGSPQNFVGEIHDADETDEGLEVRARFDVDDPVARKAYRLVKQGAIDKLSIGYRVRQERRAKDGVNELLDIELHEVSLVMNPANERARVLAIKDADAAAVPSDAALRAEAKALGINLPLPLRELRRRSDDIALQAALGWEPPPKSTPAATSDPTDRELRELRRQCDEVALQAALGWEPAPKPTSAEPEAESVPTLDELRRQAAELGIPGPPHRPRPFDVDAVRTRARDQMFALLTDTDWNG
jgi:HK97 family phage prohead protease